MGLFDLDMNTPQGQGFNQALLAAAQALLTPRSRGGGIGAAFGAFPQAIDRAKANAMREQLMALQGKQVGLQTDKLGFDMEQARAQQEAARARQAQFAQLVGGLPPDQQGIAQALGPDYFKGLAPQAPKAAEPTALAKLIAERDKLPADHPWRTLYDKSIEKATSHAPAPSATSHVYTGTMVPAEVDGRQAFVMPSKDGSVKVVEGVSPAGTAETAAKKVARSQAATQRAGIVIGAIDDALKQVGTTTAGPLGSLLSKVPGTDAYDLRATIDTVRANIGFQELQQMREMSPTGGALGQVAVQELGMLQAVIASLDANQSPAQLRSKLQAAKKHFQNWQNVVQQASGGSSGGGDANGGDPLGIR